MYYKLFYAKKKLWLRIPLSIFFLNDRYFAFLFRKMFRNRNDYHRQWMVKKRKSMRMQRAADRSIQLSSESDASHSKVKVANHKEVLELVCNDAFL
jgi:hypothetical protein